MEYDPGTWDMFSDIAGINAWLDHSNANMIPEHDESMRVMKIGEEFGEAVAAYIGYTGQNPRKGQTHDLSDLLGELADVAVTALCAIQHFTGNPAITRAVMAGKISKIIDRAGIDTSAVDTASETSERSICTKCGRTIFYNGKTGQWEVPVTELGSLCSDHNPRTMHDDVKPCWCGETHDRAGALARNLTR